MNFVRTNYQYIKWAMIVMIVLSLAVFFLAAPEPISMRIAGIISFLVFVVLLSQLSNIRNRQLDPLRLLPNEKIALPAIRYSELKKSLSTGGVTEIKHFNRIYEILYSQDGSDRHYLDVDYLGKRLTIKLGYSRKENEAVFPVSDEKFKNMGEIPNWYTFYITIVDR